METGESQASEVQQETPEKTERKLETPQKWMNITS